MDGTRNSINAEAVSEIRYYFGTTTQWAEYVRKQTKKWNLI